METTNRNIKSVVLQEDEEFDELTICEGINIWGSNQEYLEQQALKELEIFVEETKKTTLEYEEDKTVDSESKTNSETKPERATFLDINGYIKKQEELRKLKLLKDNCVKENTKVNSVQNKGVKRKYEAANSVESKNFKSERDEETFHEIERENVKEHKKIVSAESSCNVESSDSEYVPSEADIEEDSDYEPPNNVKIDDSSQKKKNALRKQKKEIFVKVKDDGLAKYFKSRLDQYYKRLEQEQESLRLLKDQNEYDILENERDEEKEYHEVKGGLKVPINLWNNLYCYQQEGVKWLWKLHQSSTGGILGDEMGLGKTVQIIVFLNSLQYSRIVSNHCRITGVGPSIIVCPATVIHQWVKHFHDWCPEFRVAILHQSGSYQGNKVNLIKELHKDRGIIITTYLGILKFKGHLLEHTWHYIILDEGHKIRNPAAKVSVAVKQLRTPHRLLLTGSPMQNNLSELWSLFDFTNPGMLGNLQTFQEHFAAPILQGGFANASPMQEATALTVATALKNMISPYLLRRMKNEVNHDLNLPNKSEQVLFCSLTDEQRRLYKDFLMSEQVNSILGRGVKNWFADKFTRGNVLVSIMTLRKICNHPDLYLQSSDPDITQDEGYGFYKNSGKMIVVAALLKIWKRQGHRVLLFMQGRSMISIFEIFLERQRYKYLKMDGSTGVASRQPLIEKFNRDASYDVFLLTTRVGGLGVNLTGASRVIIYDPDWNPATDIQARERAWRIGQDKQVTIYRLLSAGTIEEKMYQRQVWKQLLSNKVLIDPTTNKFFKSSDLHDLFSLQESPNSNPETVNIFHDSRVKMQKRYEERHKKKKHQDTKNKDDVNNDLQFSEDKIQAMKNLAQQIAKSFGGKKDEESEKKTAYQKELEEQRQKKLKEKEKLKQLTPQELIEFNRLKSMMTEDKDINRLDDAAVNNVSFEKALEYSEKKSKLYHKLKHCKSSEEPAVGQDSIQEKKPGDVKFKNHKREKKKHKKKSKEKVVVDTSGTIDGMQVDGLVKSETKLKKDIGSWEVQQSQDNLVLEYLFSKRGVSEALQHDSIIENKCQSHGLRINFEAKQRAEKALEALKKSRLNKWNW